MPQGGAKQPLKDRVLDAAERVVRTRGAAHLTIDAVVAEAGVSKGGMLYHFSSKDALIRGLLQRTLDRHEERLSDLRATLPETDARADGRATLMNVARESVTDPVIGRCLLTAAAHDPALLAPIRDRLAQTLDRLEGLEDDVPMARLLFLSMVGMTLLDVLAALPLTEAQKAALRDQVRQQSSPSESET